MCCMRVHASLAAVGALLSDVEDTKTVQKDKSGAP